MVLLISHRAPRTAEDGATLAAAGAQIFEIDLRAINGQVYVTHFLPVAPGVAWLERDGWRFQPRPRQVTAESMSAVISRLPAGSRVALDLKDDRRAGAARLVDLILRSDIDADRVYVSSKLWPSLVPLRDAGFRTWRTVDTRLALWRLLRDNDPVPHHGATVRHQLLNRGTMAAIRERSPRIFAWTVNNEARARYLVSQGIDGITSDRAEVLRAISSEASAWEGPRGDDEASGHHRDAC